MASGPKLSAYLSLDSSGVTSGLNNAAAHITGFAQRMGQQFSLLRGSFSLLAGGSFIAETIQARAGFEKLERQLAAVTGSAAEGAVRFRQLREMASMPGLDMSSSVDTFNRLKAMGYSSKEALENVQVLANKVAAFGGGAEELQGVVMALSQIRDKGSASAEEFNQLAERLPGIRNDIREIWGTANPDDLREMGISTREVVEKLIEKFKEAPTVASGLNEKIQELKLSWQEFSANIGTATQMLVPLATAIFDIHKGIIDLGIITANGIFGAGVNPSDAKAIERFYDNISHRLDESNKKKEQAEEDAAAREEEEKARLERQRKRDAEVKKEGEENAKKYFARQKELESFREQVRSSDIDQLPDEKRVEAIDKELARFKDYEAKMESICQKAEKMGILTQDEVDFHSRINSLLKERQGILDKQAKEKEEKNEKEKREQEKANEEKKSKQERAEELAAEKKNEATRNRIQEGVERELEKPSGRRQRIREENDRKRAEKRFFSKAVSDEMGKIQYETDFFEEGKRGKFRDINEIRRRAKENVARDWKEASKDQLMTLRSIETILTKLATA